MKDLKKEISKIIEFKHGFMNDYRPLDEVTDELFFLFNKKMDEVREKIEERKKFLESDLLKTSPEIFKEQKHLDKGSIERTYWHYGYLIALSDILAKLQKKRS